MVSFYDTLRNSVVGNIYSYQTDCGEIEFYKITEFDIKSKFGLLDVTADIVDKNFKPKTKGIPLSPKILEDLVLIVSPSKSEIPSK